MGLDRCTPAMAVNQPLGGESSCHLLATRLVLTVRWRTSSRQKLKATDAFDGWRYSIAAYEVHHHH